MFKRLQNNCQIKLLISIKYEHGQKSWANSFINTNQGNYYQIIINIA